MLYYGPSYKYNTYACVNYWFVVLANNVSIPCKCICYEITKIVPTFYSAKERFCVIYYIRFVNTYTTGIIGTILYPCKNNVQFAKPPLFMYILT